MHCGFRMIHFPTVKALLKPYNTKFLAVSGGSDSIAMLDIMSKIYDPEELVVCYFEHNTDAPRGEAKFIRKQMAKKKRWRDIPFETTSFIDGFNQYSFEAVARNQRYNWLARLAGPKNCIITAHHQDDQIETVLFRLFTNRHMAGIQTELHWLQTIAHRKPKLKVESKILRPFLSYPKSELTDWIERHSLKYMADPTNEDSSYADRNFIRNEILKGVTQRFGHQDHLLSLLPETSQ